jgi:DNA-binding sugar fermentation-stimulating protein
MSYERTRIVIVFILNEKDGSDSHRMILVCTPHISKLHYNRFLDPKYSEPFLSTTEPRVCAAGIYKVQVMRPLGLVKQVLLGHVR